MKILRVSDIYVDLWKLSSFFNEKDVLFGDRFGISWKQGKRRKLRAYRLLNHESIYCDRCCDRYTEIVVRRNGKEIRMDNHFGIPTLSMTA